MNTSKQFQGYTTTPVHLYKGAGTILLPVAENVGTTKQGMLDTGVHDVLRDACDEINCGSSATWRTAMVEEYLFEVCKPAMVPQNSTDRVFGITRVNGQPYTIYASSGVLAGARLICSAGLSGADQSHLASTLNHLVTMPNLLAAAQRVLPSMIEEPARGGSGEWKPDHSLVAGPSFGLRLPMLRSVMKRWVGVHHIFYCVLGAAAGAMEAGEKLVDNGCPDLALAVIQAAEGLVRDSAQLFSIATPPGIVYRGLVRPWMKATAPKLSGGDGSEHIVFLHAWRKLQNTFRKVDSTSVLGGAFANLRATYDLAFVRHACVCNAAVGARNSLKGKEDGHTAPDTLLKLRKARLGTSPPRCPITRLLRFFSEPKL